MTLTETIEHSGIEFEVGLDTLHRYGPYYIGTDRDFIIRADVYTHGTKDSRFVTEMEVDTDYTLRPVAVNVDSVKHSVQNDLSITFTDEGTDRIASYYQHEGVTVADYWESELDRNRTLRKATRDIVSTNVMELLAALTGEIVPDIEEESHECEECGSESDGEHGLSAHQDRKHSDDEETETNTEEPTMTESNTDDMNAKAMTDGGTEEIRDSNEVQHSDNEIRRYSADGHLYAYREGDDHVVISRGGEPRTQWTERVSAERDAVLAGEHLWTIPDNWQQRVNIKGAAETRHTVYHIPETGVDVLVTVPNKNHLVDAWYSVKCVGTLNVTYDDEIAWDELEATIETVRDIEEVSDDVVEALETLHRRRRSFERRFAEEVNMYAGEALFGSAHEPVSVQQWTTDPWTHTFDVDDLVQDFLDLDDETRDAVPRELSEANVLPHYPTVRVDVEEDEGVPEGYDIRALVESGASDAETIDYLITEHYDLMTQTDWSEIRGKGSSAISKNISGAMKELSD